MKIERPLNLNKHLFEDYSDSIYTKLNENGYKRIWEHCSNGFFIISASGNEYNEPATNKLKRDLSIMGYKFIELKGYYNSNIPDVSFIVPFNSNDDEIDNYAFNDAINLMPRYQQELVLIYDKYANDTGMYYINKNCKLEYAGEFHKIEDINKYMPLLKRKEKDYTYESIGIRTLKGHESLCPYYQYLKEGYIPISSDFKKLVRRRFVNIEKDNKNTKKESFNVNKVCDKYSANISLEDIQGFTMWGNFYIKNNKTNEDIYFTYVYTADNNALELFENGDRYCVSIKLTNDSNTFDIIYNDTNIPNEDMHCITALFIDFLNDINKKIENEKSFN